MTPLDTFRRADRHEVARAVDEVEEDIGRYIQGMQQEADDENSGPTVIEDDVDGPATLGDLRRWRRLLRGEAR